MNSKELRLLGEAYAAIQEGYGKKKKEKDCVDKAEKGEHNCAKKVCHESFGEGTCIFGEHAVPDENGFVSHYDVMFEHGVERNVPVEDMEVLVLEEHPMEGHRYEGEQIAEMDIVGTLRRGLEKIGVKGTSPALEKEKAADRETRRLGVNRMRQAEGDNTRPTPLKDDVDLFDIVKGHLMSEGYADTEEAALAIMANMSEEWRQTILEADSVEKMRRRSEERRRKRYGSEGGGRDDYRPYTEDDYKNPKPGYGSSQVKPA
jgi:hypothetical protein